MDKNDYKLDLAPTRAGQGVGKKLGYELKVSSETNLNEIKTNQWLSIDRFDEMYSKLPSKENFLVGLHVIGFEFSNGVYVATVDENDGKFEFFNNFDHEWIDRDSVASFYLISKP